MLCPEQCTSERNAKVTVRLVSAAWPAILHSSLWNQSLMSNCAEGVLINRVTRLPVPRRECWICRVACKITFWPLEPDTDALLR